MYNILGEFCCLLIAIVFLVFIINSFYLRERRNFLFLLCNISLIFACVSDILSCYGIEYYEKCSYFFCVSTSTVYFLSLCLLPFLYCLYFYASISAVHKFSKFFHGTLFLFFGIYLFIVIANIWTGWLFSFVPGIGYVRGKLKYSTYEITFLMIIAIEIAVIRHRRSMSSRMFTVFVLYPIISAFVSLIQIFKPSWLLSGCSGTITMVLMYLAIQSDQIEIDYKSGLKTEQHLSRTLRKKIKTVYSLCNLYRKSWSPSGNSWLYRS